MKSIIFLDGSNLNLEIVNSVAREKDTEVRIADSAISNIEKSRAWVEQAVNDSKIIYGITTGFGNFKDKFISAEQTAELQQNIIRSHACGVGEPFTEDVVRAAILLRANSLIKGYSGVRIETIQKLLDLLNKNIYPYVPCQGSVGSSGDLSPLCHIILVLIGEGECLEEGKRVPTSKVFGKEKLSNLTLASKEGLALSNGTNVQTAVLALAAYDAKKLLHNANVIAALTVEVLMGSRKPFHEKINALRQQEGQIEVAKHIRSILENSPIIDSHKNCGRVQDSYSLRCIPQVHGACLDSLNHVIKIVERELNAVTDNPIIIPEEDQAVSGGNFHGEPIAQAADFLKIALSEIGNISERRTAKMVDPATNDNLPAFLIQSDKAGLHSGLMIPQYTAAALVSENKVLSHPASVDSIPTSANQEDHVSMGTIAARQAAEILKNVQNVLAIEMLNNTQAYEFRKPLELSPITKALYEKVRSKVPAINNDRPFYIDIEMLRNILIAEKF